MEDPYNQTSSSYSINTTLLDPELFKIFHNVCLTIDSLVFVVALPLICMAVYGLYSLVKTGHVGLVYVINLLISDVVQMSSKLIISVIRKFNINVFEESKPIYMFGLLVNICLMVCISAERYTMTAHPFWYRNSHTIRTSVYVSVIVWIIMALVLSITYIYFDQYYLELVILVLLLPYPMVISFVVGTWRALNKNVSVPRHDQRRIMGTLGLILCIYTVLFLPYIVVLMGGYYFSISSLHPDETISGICLSFSIEIAIAFNPLFDFLVYVFTRRDVKDIFRTYCFCVKKHEENPFTTVMGTIFSVFNRPPNFQAQSS